MNMKQPQSHLTLYDQKPQAVTLYRQSDEPDGLLNFCQQLKSRQVMLAFAIAVACVAAGLLVNFVLNWVNHM